MRIKNTLSRSVEEFLPVGDPVLLYSCGPTVYSYAHIGNFRSFLLGDVLRRRLEQRGHRVRHVMNITDVGHLTEDHLADAGGEDKLSRAARELGWDPFRVAAHFEGAFAEDARALRMKNYLAPEGSDPALHPRATDHVPEMLAMIQTLIDRGHAYLDPQGQVYYSVATCPGYGQLSGKVAQELEAGARVQVRAEKRDPRDFALWKVDAKHLMRWDPRGPAGWAPGHRERLLALVPGGIDPRVGVGFPGWHIECSAMSRARLGPVIDIHTGGEDNVFPHHECEIAQGFGARGRGEPEVFCRFWVHARHLLVNGAKMSKRDGTLVTVRELLDPRAAGRPDLAMQLEAAGFAQGRAAPEVLRLALVSTPFTQPMNFTVEALAQARVLAERVQALHERLVSSASEGVASPAWGALLREVGDDFDEALDSNLNMPRALSALSRVVSLANQHQESGADAAAALRWLERADEVLAILDRSPRGGFLSTEDLARVQDLDEVWRLIAERAAAKQRRDFGRADEIRELLAARGVEVEDQRDGVRWRLTRR